MQDLNGLKPERLDAVEDPLAGSEQDRRDVQRELVDDPGDERLPNGGGAARDVNAVVAGVVDELTLDIAPVLLGSGERIFDGVGSLGLEPVEVLHSPLATHIRYRRAS